MKDKRIVASLREISLPVEREDALLHRILREADAQRAFSETEREKRNMKQANAIMQKRAVSRRTGKRKRRARRMRWMIPAAAALVLMITLFSIPSVSQAVRGWFLSAFRLPGYMAEPPGSRETNADIEQAITTPDPGAQRVMIQYLDETEWFEDVNKWRAENGYPAFDRADYGWIAALQPEVTEVLYDGQNCIVNTRFYASPLRFIGGYGGEGERFDIWTRGAAVTVDGAPYEGFEMEGGGLILPQLYYDNATDSWDMEKARQAGDVTVQTRLTGNGQQPTFPSGQVEITLTTWVLDGTIDDMAAVGIVAVVTQTLTFDTTAGNGMLGQASAVTQRLSGTVPLTVRSADGRVENRTTDLATVSVTATVLPRTTGMGVSLHYDYELPPDLNERDYWFALAGGAASDHGILYELIVDGQSRGLLHTESISLATLSDPVLEIPLTESELAAVQSVVLRPSVSYMAAYNETSNDRATAIALLPDEPVYLTGYSDFRENIPLTGCDIVLPVP